MEGFEKWEVGRACWEITGGTPVPLWGLLGDNRRDAGSTIGAGSEGEKERRWPLEGPSPDR
jgi:hypothetical protein